VKRVSLNGPALTTAIVLCCVVCKGTFHTAFAVKPSSTIPGKGASPEAAPLGEDLFKRLLGDDAQDDPEDNSTDENPLDNAIKGMRTAEERIGNQDLGSETQDIQRKIVTDLQKLIDLAKQRQQQQSQRRQQGNRNQNNRQPNASQQQDPGDQQQQNQTSPSEQNRKKPEDSGAGARADETNSAERLRQRQMVEEVWGHLPPALRERMLNVFGEKYLPSYDELIRRYFKSLAEDKPSRRRK